MKSLLLLFISFVLMSSAVAQEKDAVKEDTLVPELIVYDTSKLNFGEIFKEGKPLATPFIRGV